MWLAVAFGNPEAVAQRSRRMTQELSWARSMVAHMQIFFLSLTINSPFQFYALQKTLKHSEDLIIQYFSTDKWIQVLIKSGRRTTDPEVQYCLVFHMYKFFFFFSFLLSLNSLLFLRVGVHYEANDLRIGTNHPCRNPFIHYHRNGPVE